MTASMVLLPATYPPPVAQRHAKRAASADEIAVASLDSAAGPSRFSATRGACRQTKPLVGGESGGRWHHVNWCHKLWIRGFSSPESVTRASPLS